MAFWDMARVALDAVLDCGDDFTTIALDAGFASHSHFTARFRSFFGFTAEPSILALTAAADGKIYLLARNQEGACVLDRLDPALSQLERLPLSLQFKGRATIAAGKEALYVVAYNGREGRWRIPWLSLEQAAWKKLKFTPEGQEAGPDED